METSADMATYSWLKSAGGSLFLISSVSSIMTLIYGHMHVAAIREHRSVSYLLTAYRVLFWLSVIVSMLAGAFLVRSEEHTSELQSLMRISYAVFCLKKKRHSYTQTDIHILI